MVYPTTLVHEATTKRILDLLNLYPKNLNLEPSFQRQSVWSERDRAKLIDSIIRNYPIPAIFLYKREKDGHLVFDVLDGKQRLESIFMFIGAIRGKRFRTKTQIPGDVSEEWLDWSILQKRQRQSLITGYKIPVIEVDGEPGDVINVFVRINSTGKALTGQEKRHAKFHTSPFLKEATRLAGRFQSYFLTNGIFSQGELSRMKHIEPLCELLLSVIQGDVLNKKTALDRVMESKSVDGRQLGKASRIVVTTLNRIVKLFPKIGTTRFRQVTDFYSLAVLFSRFEQEGFVLTDRRMNTLAWDLLREFGTQVDSVRELQRKARGAKPEQELYREYLLTVSQMTDDVSQRRKRQKILHDILGSLFAKKDSQRGFTPEQRRIIWNTSANRVCAYAGGCKTQLTWNDFQIDHINPHSHGGRSQIENAALMCGVHNRMKGNKAPGKKFKAG